MRIIGNVAGLDLALAGLNQYVVLSPYGRVLGPTLDRLTFLRYVRDLRASGVRVALWIPRATVLEPWPL